MTTAALAVAVLLAAPAAPLVEPQAAFATGPAASAKAAFDAGRWREAASRFAAVKGPEAAFLRAVALVEAGSGAEAVRALDRLEAALPDLSDRIALVRGRALEKAGRNKDALAAWSSVPDASRVAPEARLARARLSAAAGDRDGALQALQPLLSLEAPDDPQKPDLGATALLLAGRLHARGPGARPDAARRAFIDCWAGHPLATESQECVDAVKALPAPHAAEPGPEDQLRRAEELAGANRNDLALKILVKLLPSVPPAGSGEAFACRARAALGRARRKDRDPAKAAELLRPVVEACDDPALRVRSLFVLAGAASAAGEKEEAIALYRRLARDYPQHPLADDALFNASDLLVRAGRELEAREALAVIVKDMPGSDHRDEARFRLAWISRRAGDADGAIAQLLAIEESARDVDPYEHGRAAYWRGRILAARGEAGARAARAIWSDLAARYPADYYGLLARVRLLRTPADACAPPSAGAPAKCGAPASAGAPAEADATLSPVPAVATAPAAAPAWDPGPLAEDPHFRAGVMLLRLGLDAEAADELGAVDTAKLVGQGDAPEAVLVVADLLDRAGDHRTAHQLLRTRARAALRKSPSGANLRAWRLAYPPAWRDDVKRFAPPAGVPVNLLQALMREESALDPRAVSPVGAIGLTQLMLPTAREVARQLKLRRPSRADLMKGSLNIRLGARYLGQLIRRFDGSVPLAVAAYNAGGGAVSRWLGAKNGLELDEFVEDIPYEETRGYVKRVLRSYAAYRLLYGATGDSELGLFPGPGRI